ncbi:MAG: hypothetical protein ACXWYS_09585 [Gaiellaceae bacterium]
MIFLRTHHRAATAGAVALLAIAGGGAAVAATQSGSPQAESNAVVADAASQLGITPAKLSDALETALSNRVDAAVAAGRLTAAQGKELKAQIAAGNVPLVGVGGGPGGHGFRHHGPGPGLDAAATYLGVTEAQLHTALESGKTLADVAKANGKTVSGLVDAMVADAKEHIAAEVAAGRMTKAQQTQILSDLEQHITDRVNGQMPDGPHRGPGGPGGPGFGPPPAQSSSSTTTGAAA